MHKPIIRRCPDLALAMRKDQVRADEVVLPPKSVIEKTNHMYRPGTRRTYGLLEWPAMRRLADRLDSSYKI